VRTYWRSDGLARRGEAGVVSIQGSLVVFCWDPRVAGMNTRWEWSSYRADDSDDLRRHFLTGGGWYWSGFGYERFRGRAGTLAVPFWLLTLGAAATLARAARARRRRPPSGHCQSCGYDLTANASGRCPECGVGIPSAVTEASRDSLVVCIRG
jgi:hypothetical protein